MKNIIARIMVFVMTAIGLSALTACGVRSACYVILPEEMPEGVESITCNSTYTENDVTKAGTTYDGKYEIKVTFKAGYELGELKILADGKEITKHKYYVDKTESENSISYKFEGVRKDVTITTEGSVKKIDYSITLAINQSNTKNTIFKNAIFVYSTTIDGVKTSSEQMTGETFKTIIGEKLTVTMHYGDMFEITVWNSDAYSYVFNPYIENMNETSYNIDDTGVVKTTKTVEIQDDLDIVLHESTLTEHDDSISVSIDDFTKTETVIVDSSLSPIKEAVTLSEIHEETGSLSLAFLPTAGTIEEFVLENYSDTMLTFKLNGKEINKGDMGKSGGYFYIFNVGKPYEYSDENGNTAYKPNEYFIEIDGLEQFLQAKEEYLVKTEISVAETKNFVSVSVGNVTLLGYYLKSERTIIKVIAVDEIPTFNLAYTTINNEQVLYNAFNTEESGSTAQGDQVVKTVLAEHTEWEITTTSTIQVITVN